MADFSLLYDRTVLPLHVEEANLAGVLISSQNEYRSSRSGEELIEEALDNPIGSPPLEELARGKERIVIISSDHTRPVPAHLIIPAMLRRIRKYNSNARVTILVATGFHRSPTEEELIAKYTKEVLDQVHIVIHDSRDDEAMVSIGTLPSGGECLINRTAAEADLLLSDGFIEAHLFAGFSGGRKAVLPGIASYRTIQYNHSGPFIASPLSRTGNLEDNPVHRDMVYAARAAGLSFIVNVALNEKKEIIKAFAGDVVMAHETGCGFVKELARVKKVPADIVVTTNSGYPSDQNLYQSVKGMTAAEAASSPGGVIILVAGCRDGHGGEAFFSNMTSEPSPALYYDKASSTPAFETRAEQWGSQIFARILKEYRLLLVSTFLDRAVTERLGIEQFATPDEALERAYELKGRSARVAVIPDGLSVIVEN